ncbi:hypothetical protein AAMO2058_001258500 [Amorphochlora amoebiformis]
MKTIRSYFKPKATPLKRSATVDSEEFSTPSVRKSARTEGKKDAKDHEDKENLLNQSGLPTLESDTSMKESLQPGLQRAESEPVAAIGSQKQTKMVTRASTTFGMSDAQKAKIQAKKRIAQEKLLAKKRAVGNPFKTLETLVPESWSELLQDEFPRNYFRFLKESLVKEHNKGKKIFPKPSQIFRAFEICPLDKIKVVIIGQDPYHNTGQAEGLCFSVPRGIAIPSSLRNIYKELKADIKGFRIPQHGNLVKWAEQGVFLLNTGLTVRAHEANSHKKYGWQLFTDAVVKVLNRKKGLVFVLWGGHAQKKAANLTRNRHCIIKSAHPSGLSAHRGFFGSRPFSKINKYLEESGKNPIKWQV